MNKFTGEPDVSCDDALIMTDLVQNSDNYGYIMYLKYLFKNNFFWGGEVCHEAYGIPVPQPGIETGP